MDPAATCKYYVTKLLGISPPKPNCVYDVRSGNARDREQKSLFRVFYRSSNGRRRKHRRVHVQESYVPTAAREDEAGARIGDGGERPRRHALEEDTVEDIEKKFQGFRNVFEKCKVKKKKPPPRLYNVSSGLRFTLVANTMLLDGQKRASEAAAAAADEGPVVIAEEDDDDDGCGEGDDDEDDEVAQAGQSGADEPGGDERPSDFAGNGSAAAESCSSSSRCPKDVADKVNSWIDSSVKRTDDEYSEEEECASVDDDEVHIII